MHTFHREIASAALFSEMLPLLQLHQEELAHYKDIELEPNFAQYEALENAGVLKVFTVRDEKWALIGYCVYFVSRHLHYTSTLQASQDLIFIHPDKRGFGSKFIKWIDEQLRADGVQVVYQHIKAKKNFGPMLERQGYELCDLVYTKRIG